MCIGHETVTVKEESRNSKNQVVKFFFWVLAT